MCAIREVREETGICLENQDLDKLFKVNHHNYFLVHFKDRPSVCIDYNEIIDYEWVLFSDIESLTIGTMMRRVIKQILSYRQ